MTAAVQLHGCLMGWCFPGCNQSPVMFLWAQLSSVPAAVQQAKRGAKTASSEALLATFDWQHETSGWERKDYLINGWLQARKSIRGMYWKRDDYGTRWKEWRWHHGKVLTKCEWSEGEAWQESLLSGVLVGREDEAQLLQGDHSLMALLLGFQQLD